jgi:hypothetical protein
MLCNAGRKGGVYLEYIFFSSSEIKSFLGLYLLNGLSPSPQMKKEINGSDLCHNIFGKNAKKRHKHFKYFFLPRSYALDFP